MRKTVIIALLPAVAVLMLGHNPVSADQTTSATPKTEQATVLRIIDGDTLSVRLRDRSIATVRLVGVDTPETKKPGTPVQCYGPEATKAATRLAAGKTVTLEIDPVAGDKDRYGRLLRHVFIKKTSMAVQLIKDGFGRAYAYKNQRYSYRAIHEQAEDKAQASRKGLWLACSQS